MCGAIFAAVLGVGRPWYTAGTRFDRVGRASTSRIDFKGGTRLSRPAHASTRAICDVQSKQTRHRILFRHECYPELSVLREALPGGQVAQVDPHWVGKLLCLTQLVETLVMPFCKCMPFGAMARLIGLSSHRVEGICRRCIDLAPADPEVSGLSALAIGEM